MALSKFLDKKNNENYGQIKKNSLTEKKLEV